MRFVRTALLATLVLATVAVMTAPAVLAGDPAAKDQAPAESREEKKADSVEVLTFTNEDLESRFGPAPARPTPATGDSPTAAPETDKKDGTQKPDGKTDTKTDTKTETVPDHEMDPLEWMDKRKADAAERQTARAEAQEEVSDAEERVKQLQDRLLRIRNPLLARPEATMNDEEKSEWEGQNSTSRVAMTERQLEEAKVALEEARAELARLQ